MHRILHLISPKKPVGNSKSCGNLGEKNTPSLYTNSCNLPPLIIHKSTSKNFDEFKPIMNEHFMPSGMMRDEWSISDFVVSQTLHKGQYTTLYKGICTKSNTHVVLKTIRISRSNVNSHKAILREIEIHNLMDHDNIVKLYVTFRSKNHMIMVMEECDMDLYTLLHSSKCIDPSFIGKIVRDLVKTMKYIHDKGICHRDIKVENLLIKQGMLKVCDFGIAIDMFEEGPVTPCGTKGLMAPEVERCPLKYFPEDNKDNVDLHYDNKCDIWSIGVTAYELIIGMKPICYDTLKFPKYTDKSIIDFISACLHDSPSLRPSCEQLLSSKYLKEYETPLQVQLYPSYHPT